MSSITLDMKQAYPAGMAEQAGKRLHEGLNTTVTQSLTTGGLAIKAGGGVLAKIVTAVYALVNSKLVLKAAATDMAALSGTVSNAAFNVFVFYMEQDGTLSTVMGTEGASLLAVAFPAAPIDKACIGFTVINPTGTGDFVGGTTALDDATVVPNAVYVNTPFAFSPKAGVTLAT